MTDNIVTLPGVTLPANDAGPVNEEGPEPNENLIGLLEELLEKARAGQVQSLGAFGVFHNNCGFICLSGRGEHLSSYEMAGAAARVKYVIDTYGIDRHDIGPVNTGKDGA